MHAPPSGDVLDLEIDEAVRSGRYELNEADFIRRIVRRGDTTIDLGAHVGVHTTLLADLVGATGSVIAIEPASCHVAQLEAAVWAAGAAERVTIVAAAAGDAAGDRLLLVSAPGQSSRHAWLLPSGHSAGPLDVVEHVRVVRVDDVPRRGRVSFVKIDVEGAESLAIAGASAMLTADRPVLLVDLHPHLHHIVSGEGPAGLIGRLRAMGYRCHLLGAGMPSTEIVDIPSNAVTPVVFLPDAIDSRTSRDTGR
jgi:FkbM family methyltransferase